MSDTQPRSQRFRGRSPPDRPEWSVSTVCRRGTNRSAIGTCAVTGDEVALDAGHYYVTLLKSTSSPARPDEYDHLIVRDGALDELDEWLEDRS